MREIRVLFCGRQFLARQDADTRRALLDLCLPLGDDPFVDGETKFVYPTPPVFVYKILKREGFWVIYRDLPDTIRVMNIGREGVDPYTIYCPALKQQPQR